MGNREGWGRLEEIMYAYESVHCSLSVGCLYCCMHKLYFLFHLYSNTSKRVQVTSCMNHTFHVDPFDCLRLRPRPQPQRPVFITIGFHDEHAHRWTVHAPQTQGHADRPAHCTSRPDLDADAWEAPIARCQCQRRQRPTKPSRFIHITYK
jgi:hypothetical protein